MNNVREDNFIEARQKVKEILMDMNGLSEECFNNKALYDPHFSKGFHMLIDLFMQAKFNA